MLTCVTTPNMSFPRFALRGFVLLFASLMLLDGAISAWNQDFGQAAIAVVWGGLGLAIFYGPNDLIRRAFAARLPRVRFRPASALTEARCCRDPLGLRPASLRRQCAWIPPIRECRWA